MRISSSDLRGANAKSKILALRLPSERMHAFLKRKLTQERKNARNPGPDPWTLTGRLPAAGPPGWGSGRAEPGAIAASGSAEACFTMYPKTPDPALGMMSS